MEVNNKYKYGDQVWYMNDNNIKCSQIFGIKINMAKNDIMFIQYDLYDTNVHGGKYEKDLFDSKEELLQDLSNEYVDERVDLDS